MTKLHSDPSQALNKKSLIALGSQQRRFETSVSMVPHDGVMTVAVTVH